MKRGYAFYKPMLRINLIYSTILFYFVYCNLELEHFARVIVENHMNIPKSQVIGSESKIIASNKKNRIILDFDLKKTDNLVLTGDLSKIYY